MIDNKLLSAKPGESADSNRIEEAIDIIVRIGFSWIFLYFFAVPLA